MARAAGFEAFEPVLGAEGELTPATTEDAARRLGDSIREAGLEVSSLATGLFWSTPYTSLDAGIRKTRKWQESIQSYQSVIDFNENLLKTQVARLNAGTIEPRKVLEVGADLFESRQSLAEAHVQRQRAGLALESAEGII